MAGATDSPMRRLCRSLGADGSTTEMISAKAVCYGDEKTGALSSVTAGEGDVSVQLFGHEPDIIAEAARRVLSGELPGARYEIPVAAIDINMGCPVRKIVQSGDGSALMRDPALAAEIVRKASAAAHEFGVPLTVKIRSGWDAEHINAPDFACRMVEAGADAVTVHARTREQMYRPGVDLDVIRRVKEAVGDIPVIGNGDIVSAHDAFYMVEYTGCDSVAVGRAALGDPWIFSAIRAAKPGEKFTPPSREERIATALRLIREVIEEKGEYVGVREARGRVAHFIRGMRGAPEVRDRINHAETYKEIEKILLEGLVKESER